MGRRSLRKLYMPRVGSAAPKPPGPPVAPRSGRVPAVGDVVEVRVARLTTFPKPRGLVEWAAEPVAKLCYDVSPQGFETEKRRCYLHEEGVNWRWPKRKKGDADADRKA